MPESPSSRAARGIRDELLMVLVPVGLVILTMVVLLDPSVAPGAINLRLALAVDLTATLVAAAIAILAWVHFREGREPAALLRGSAFVALGSLNALFAAAAVVGAEGAFGLDAADPGQLPLWSTATSRTGAAALLAMAGIAALRGSTVVRWPPALTFWLPGLTVVGLTLAVAVLQVSLPTLIPPEQIARLLEDPRQPLEAAAAPGYVAWQMLIGLCYLAAAALSYRVYRR
ncbi:MAG TPA: hypothetical protein VHK28_09300, partial [Candidatus Limnocylindria bacterium]|nr:hypothetical protein [Candidatus Limnocylindria bacterium]